MKKIILLFSILVTAFITALAQKPIMKPFRLEGTILNSDTIKEVNISIFWEHTISSEKAKVINQKFVFEGGLEHPTLALISTNNIRQEFGVWLVNDTIQVDFEVKKREAGSLYLHTKKVSGSQESIDFTTRIEPRNAMQSKKFTDAQRKKMVYQSLEKYVNEHKGSYLSLQNLSNEISFGECDLSSLEDLFERLSEEVKLSDSGKYFKEKLAKYRKNTIGNRIPDLKIPNQAGDSVILSSLIKGKTIISFWASWCGPCREKHKDMVKNQRLFEDKSVKIIGISLDDDQQKWLKAIKTDNINWWTNLADLQGGFDSKTAQTFKITSVPFMILVDDKMRILENDYQSILVNLRK